MSHMHSADERDYRENCALAASLGLMIVETYKPVHLALTVSILECLPGDRELLIERDFEMHTQWNQNVWIRKQLNDYQSWK